MNRLRKYFMLLLYLSLYAVQGLYCESFAHAVEVPVDTHVATPYDYSAIDDHALNAPAEVEGSLETLVAYLTKPAKNDREKVRAIFRWITSRVSYDQKSYLSGARTDSSPEGVLTSRTSVCSGYSQLFQALAQKAGIKCEFIRGYAKGYGYSVGYKIDKVNHDWNAVFIDGSWYLLDATWGAGTVSGKNFSRKFEDFFFLTRPELFIVSHYPVEPQWQLLQQPVSRQVFDSFNKPFMPFFKLGLDWESLNHKESELRVRDRAAVLLTHDIPLAYTTVLQLNGKALPFSTFVESTGTQTTVYAEFPEPGKYELMIFAKRIGLPDSFAEVLSYVVYADGTAPGEPKGFPLAYGEFYRSRAELYSPKQGYLNKGAIYPFRVRIPGADKVAIIMGREFIDLSNVGNDVFEGSVQVTNSDLMVSYQNTSSKGFIGVLKYTVSQTSQTGL